MNKGVHLVGRSIQMSAFYFHRDTEGRIKIMAASINRNYENLKENYLFAEISKRVKAYETAHPEADIIRMGIGDVTRPLPPAVVKALEEASEEMGNASTFRGYGPEQGYEFLREAIRSYYRRFGVERSLEEIFISDGAKSDLGNILDIFGLDNTVLVTDPVYPVYVDTNIMAGRDIIYAKASEENQFLPMPEPGLEADLIYLCSPNNPTGAVYNREQLKEWVDFANKNGSVILFDSAYECFVTGEIPHSIFEIEGAESCAIEFCSFSKKAGFTGTRCGYTVVPMALVREGISLNHLWLRRQTTKFNGVPYIVQRAAASVFTEEGEKQIRENLDYYRENARIITDTLDNMKIWYTGGSHSPYIWLKCPDGMDSWTFFDEMLCRANIVGTPGEGFGEGGKYYFRLTAFSTREATREAMERFRNIFGKD